MKPQCLPITEKMVLIFSVFSLSTAKDEKKNKKNLSEQLLWVLISFIFVWLIK